MKPPLLDEAATFSAICAEASTSTLPVALIVAPESTAVVLLIETPVLDAASLTETSPPESTTTDERVLAKPCAVMLTFAPLMVVLPCTSVATVTLSLELAVPLLTAMRPPPPPDAVAVTTPSPTGAPAGVLPPMPRNCCVPLEVPVMSKTSLPPPPLVKSTPSTAKFCGPPLRPPVSMSMTDPPGVCESWKLLPVALTT